MEESVGGLGAHLVGEREVEGGAAGVHVELGMVGAVEEAELAAEQRDVDRGPMGDHLYPVSPARRQALDSAGYYLS